MGDFLHNAVSDNAHVMGEPPHMPFDPVRRPSDDARNEKELPVQVPCGFPSHPAEQRDECMFSSAFTQSSKTRTGSGGTGLGLAICKEIVDAHRGCITATNRTGESGAIVSFSVPRISLESASARERTAEVNVV